MERFGASRTVIREAIKSLSSRGLVECKPRHRPVVRKPGYQAILAAANDVVSHLLNDYTGVKNLHESRVFIERSLVREAALRARKQDITGLREALEANEAAIQDSDEFYLTDVAFHGVLYKIPRNPIFPAIHQGYVAWLKPHWEKMHRSPERNDVNFRAHKEIFNAICERDPEQADEALRNHLLAAWEYVRGTFEFSHNEGSP